MNKSKIVSLLIIASLTFCLILPITLVILGNGSFTIQDSELSKETSGNTDKDMDYIYTNTQTETYTDITMISPEDISYNSPMSGYYLATYGFENDLIDANPSRWIVNEEGDTSVKIISEIDAHKNVVELYDNSESFYPEIKNIFENQNRGTIEFWLKLTDHNDNGRSIYIRDGMEPEENFLYINIGEDGGLFSAVIK